MHGLLALITPNVNSIYEYMIIAFHQDQCISMFNCYLCKEYIRCYESNVCKLFF